MFTVSEFKWLTDPQTAYRILKPWWDVFSHYICMVMLLISLLGGTLQIAQNKMLCLPCKVVVNEYCKAPWESNIGTSVNNTPVLSGIKNLLDKQQYAYIDAVCYEKQLHWFSKFFPYLVLWQTLLFLICSNFWFKYPSTSSRLEHFITILHKCFDSPWTTRALSEAVEISGEKQSYRKAKQISRLSFSNLNFEMGTKFTVSRVEPNLTDATERTILDRKEGEQAKAIFEKVKKFKAHVEEKDIVYKLYMRQIIFKVILFILIISYIPYYIIELHFDINCNVDIQIFTGYQQYHCVHSLSTIFRILASFYTILVVLHGFLSVYSLYWMLRRSLKKYSFETVREESSYRDIPDIINDFAFILHLSDQYDPLYSKRFSVFLSEVSENKLKQINLNLEWTAERLRYKLQKTPQDKMELYLFMLSGLPDAVFELKELEVLKLELLTEAKFQAAMSQLTNLKELHLYHTPTTVEPQALNCLSENLQTLYIKFTDMDKSPRWIFNLKNLTELHLAGNLKMEKNHFVSLSGLENLKNLKVLYMKNSLPHIPAVVTGSGLPLNKLSIDNEGTKLTVFNTLKNMINLTNLELLYCDLERIPHSIFSLYNLREIDLKGNRLKTIEEIISFQHLKWLSCLKLWHNAIAYIPVQIGTLSNLEQLYLNNNRIESVPPQLFLCRKLRYLDLSNNHLTSFGDEIGNLKHLQYLNVSNNNLEFLPNGLFQCHNLRTLLLGKNSLTVLSPLVGDLENLVFLELIGNQFEILPEELGRCNFKPSGLIVEESVFNTLPASVREYLLKNDLEQV
ncbi:volume-regulated anion channel subunit LRRC8B-like isoform X1 [Carcharodon carcharias]|uniref:volume-regulated anion channel subunit LRRC8B-like isoform X1 n=1 Tax=Carcharodon carcharias TaxID=13397 RepID=UPI001B7EDEBA|nr:volume-regulated anion channel subunit LRRC8B-like isoform X1 [Carcharodon carcharias]